MNSMFQMGTQAESEALPSAILDSFEDIITVLDKTGTIIAVNDAWKRFASTNGAPEPVRNGVGVNYLDVCRRAVGEFSEEAPAVLMGIQSVLNGFQQSFSVEYPCDSPEQKRWFQLKVSSLLKINGGVIVSHRSITVLKGAEEARLKSEERFRRLVSVMPAALFTCDAEGLITYYNRVAAELWGREPNLNDPGDKYCGSFLLFQPDGSPMPHDQCPMAEAVMKGTPARDKEILIMRPDGSMINASVNIDPLYDEMGVRTGAINVFRDITERKRLWDENQHYKSELEDRIIERTRELNQLNKTLLEEIDERRRVETELGEVQGRLMDSVDGERVRLARELHDGPMQEIYGLMFSIASIDDTLSMEEREQEILTVQTKLQEINEVLRAITRELRPATLAPLGLEQAIRESADRIQNEQPTLQVNLDLKADGILLPERIRYTLYRIYQVAFTNVLRHAAATTVNVRFTFNEQQILLEVQDNGCGFDVPDRWVDYAREGHLGLVGALERAESIRGRLEVASKPGGGTLIRVVVPVK